MGDPFLFLDEAEVFADGARGSYVVQESALTGHFKHAPVMPASLLLEALGQLGVFYLLNHPKAAEAAGGVVRAETIFFVSCDGVRCSRVCRPGDRLNLEVGARRLRAPLAAFCGSVAVAGEKAARAEELVLTFGA